MLKTMNEFTRENSAIPSYIPDILVEIQERKATALFDALKEILEDVKLQTMIAGIKNNDNILSRELSDYLFKKYCKRKNLEYCQPAMCPFRAVDNCDCTNLKNYILKEFNMRML